MFDLIQVHFSSQRKETNAEKLKIKVTTQQGPAHYTCEVSADAPSFLTAEVHGSIEVVGMSILNTLRTLLLLFIISGNSSDPHIEILVIES